MRIACVGGGPAGLVFAISMKLRDPRHEHCRVRAQRTGRHVRLGRRLLRSDAWRISAPTIPQARDADRSRFRALGRYRRPHPRPNHHLLRPRLCRHRPQAAAEYPARSRPRTRRASRIPHRNRSRPGSLRRLRPRRSPATAPTANSAMLSSPTSRSTSTSAPTSTSGSAPTKPSTPSPSPSSKPNTAGSGLTPTSSTTTPRPSSSNAPKRHGARLGFDAMSQDETCRAAERLFAKYPRRRGALHQRQASARFGLAQLSAHRLPNLAREAISS